MVKQEQWYEIGFLAFEQGIIKVNGPFRSKILAQDECNRRNKQCKGQGNWIPGLLGSINVNPSVIKIRS